MGQSLSNWKRERHVRALTEMVPRKTPGHDDPLPQLDRKTLMAALSNVAASIHKKKGNVTVIAVGGAVNTIYLQSRVSTHDVDFFNNYLTAADYEHLISSAREAAKKDKTLKEEWFNNRTIFFIPKDQRHTLTQQSYEQREIIFQQPGLTVLAAPWNYAFCCKVDRMAGGGLNSARAYDLSDAVEYLRRYLARAKSAQVPVQVVQAWFTQFSLRWTGNNDVVVDRINSAYAKRFGVKHAVIC